MLETGTSARSDNGTDLRRPTCFASGRGPSWRSGAVAIRIGAACVVALFASAPVSFDPVTGEFSLNAAVAGSGDGNYGEGRGNGGPNGENPGNGGGNGGNGGGVDAGGNGGGSGDEGGGGDDGEDDGGANAPPLPSPTAEDDRDSDTGMDEAAELADEDFPQASGAPAGPGAGPAAVGLPTVRELFSLGEEAVVPADEELRLIANGWKAGN